MNDQPTNGTLVKIIRISFLVLLFLFILLICRRMPSTSMPAPAIPITPIVLQEKPPANPTAPLPGATQTGTPDLPVSSEAPGPNWVLDVIDPGPRTGLFSTLVQGQNGQQYAAYLDDQYDTLKLATNNGIQWGVKTILYTDTSAGWFPSLAFDPHEQLHLSTIDIDQQEILFGSQSQDGSWSFDIAASGVAASDTTLLFAPNGTPTIVFFDETSSEVKFITRGDDAWSAPKVISEAKKEGRYYPAAQAAGGQIQVAFHNELGGLSIARPGLFGWSVEPVDTRPGAGIDPALAIDANGAAHLSYYEQDDQDLVYATKAGSRWQSITLDAPGDVGQYSAIAVDPNGSVHITYFDATNGALKYALRRPGQNWSISTVDRQAKVGSWPALVLDLDGNPSISYYDEENQLLRYAYADVNHSQARQPRALSASHTSGQTFLIWKERADLQGEQYRIYRSSAPIDASNFSQAHLLYQVGEDSSTIWTNFFVANDIWNARLTQRMVVENGAAPLREGTGALVWTLAAEDFGGASSGEGYYAVTVAGADGKEIFSADYTFGPVAELVNDPLPVEISASTPQQPGPGGHYYLQYMDLRRWNPTFHAPNSTNEYYGRDPKDPLIQGALAYAYDYSIFAPTPELCGGQVPETLPVMIFLHGYRGNRYGTPDVYPYPYCAYGVYPIDQSETWWFGFARSHDYRTGEPVPAGDVIENFTEQRVLRMLYDLIRNPPGTAAVDQQRIYLFGHSMGGTGSLAFAQRYPNIFAAIYSGQPVTLFRFTPGVEEYWPWDTAQIWGAQDLNLPVASNAPNGWAGPIQKFDGAGVFDWQDLPSAFDPNASPKRFALDMVPFGIDHGTIDDAVIFSSQGQPIYPLLVANPRAWAGAITRENHLWSVFGFPLANLARQGDVPFYGLSVIRDETIPGFSRLSGNLTAKPTDVTSYNQTLLWSASWNPWDGAPVDNPDEWQMSFCAVDPGKTECSGKSITTDITPRRLQRFQITPGQTYTWQIVAIRGSRTIASGEITPDENGLLTVKEVTVIPGGIRLRILKK